MSAHTQIHTLLWGGNSEATPPPPPSHCGTMVQDSNTPPPWSMNNRGIPYVSACKTRSPTVGLRKLGRPRGAPGPLRWGCGGGWVGGVEAKQDQADCPPCGASPQGNKHTVGSGTACISISNYTAFTHHYSGRVWLDWDLVIVCVSLVCMFCCTHTHIATFFRSWTNSV